MIRTASFSSSSSTTNAVRNILVAAHVSKTLRNSSTNNLDPNAIPLSDSLVFQILSRNSIDVSKKIDFFKWCSLRHDYKHSASSYSLMLRTLCRSGYLEEVIILLGSMKDDGVVVGSETFKYLLDGFIRVGKFDLALRMLDHMEEIGINVHPNMYDPILVALMKKDKVQLALSIFFKLMEASDEMVPSSAVGNAMLVALKKAGMRSEFRKVFDKLREREGFELNIRGYNICIHGFGLWGDLNMSFKLFKEMKQKWLSSGLFGPDLCTYNSLIHVLCSVGKVKDALAVYEELKDSGHEPDAFTYRIIIQGCCKTYRMNDATKVFNEMQYNGFLPDTIVYNSLLDGMFKARKVTDGCKLFEKMVQDGVKASCYTYNILIDGLSRNGRAEAAYSLFCDLKKKGQFVDSVTYSIAVSLLCGADQLDEALHLLEEMEDRGFVVDLTTISSLLLAFHKQGKVERTERLMKYISNGNLVLSVLKWKKDLDALLRNPPSSKEDYSPLFPPKQGFNDIISSLTSPDSPDLEMRDPDNNGVEGDTNSSLDSIEWSSSPYMDRLANHMETRGHSSLFSIARAQRVQDKGMESFDIDMVNTFLSIFLAKGNLSLACKLFEIFTDMGVNPMSYTYNSIMSSFVKKGYFNEACNIFSQMGEQGCPTDIATYTMVIQGLGKIGRADLASSVLDKLTKQVGSLDIVMYNTLINVLGKAGRLDEAKKLFNQMKSSGVNPDVFTYNILIEVHSKAGRLKDAYNFLRMMLNSGCLPNHVTDTTLDYLAKQMEKQRG